MARPPKQGLDYFPHDTDAANDEKLDALRILHGNDGYAFYFILLERIYRTANQELDISDAETIQILARKVAVTEEVFNQILATALKHGCFDAAAYAERGVLTSAGIVRRALIVLQKRQKMKDSYSAKVSDAETPPETRQSKEKESKEKESKEKESSEEPTTPGDGFVQEGERPQTFEGWTAPTVEDCRTHGARIGYPQDRAEKFFRHYAQVEWRDPKGRRLTGWTHTMQEWKVRDDSEKKPARPGSIDGMSNRELMRL